jgi:hypothetical protein
MKNLKTAARLFIFLLIAIICCRFLLTDEPDISQLIMGKWKYVSFAYRGVGRYGQKEVDSVKASELCFNKDKVYFTKLNFIDTCFYSELHPASFFDREYKKPHYLLDGPLALKYTEQELSKFIRIDLNCKENGFGTFYLNKDTLILNSTGGITFYFTKIKSESSPENINKGK